MSGLFSCFVSLTKTIFENEGRAERVGARRAALAGQASKQDGHQTKMSELDWRSTVHVQKSGMVDFSFDFETGRLTGQICPWKSEGGNRCWNESWT